MTTWVIVLLIYAAPPTAVAWPGPWTKGMVLAGKDFFRSEGECRNAAVQCESAWCGCPFQLQPSEKVGKGVRVNSKREKEEGKGVRVNFAAEPASQAHSIVAAREQRHQ